MTEIDSIAREMFGIGPDVFVDDVSMLLYRGAAEWHLNKTNTLREDLRVTNESADYHMKRCIMLSSANERANQLIGAQAEENEKIINRLQDEILRLKHSIR